MERTVHTRDEMVNLLLAISIVSQQLADEMLQQDSTEQPRVSPMTRRRREQWCPDDSHMNDWRLDHGTSV